MADYGPALPPGFKKPKPPTKSTESETGQHHDAETSQHHDAAFGPHLPPNCFVRKSVPDSRNDIDSCSEEIGPKRPIVNSTKNKSDLIGPIKHCGILKSEATDVYGPVLPTKVKQCDDIHDIEPVDKVIPTDSSSGEEEDCFGPSPDLMVKKGEIFAVTEVEERSRRMKDKLTGKASQSEQINKRESWMTELPQKMGMNIGLSARTFKARSGPTDDDRSVWTDTPADRADKEKERAKKRKEEDDRREVELEVNKKQLSEVDSYNKSQRCTSLLEMHQEKRKKIKKNEEISTKRKAFDRETDLQVNRFDNAQRKALIKKSQELGSRFKSGGSEFL